MLMQKIKRYADWFFKDLTVRKGRYVIAEPVTLPLIVFTISILLALMTYKGVLHLTFVLVAYSSIAYWGYWEIKHGKSRFRKTLGIMALTALAGALIMKMGLG